MSPLAMYVYVCESVCVCVCVRARAAAIFQASVNASDRLEMAPSRSKFHIQRSADNERLARVVSRAR